MGSFGCDGTRERYRVTELGWGIISVVTRNALKPAAALRLVAKGEKGRANWVKSEMMLFQYQKGSRGTHVGVMTHLQAGGYGAEDR